VLAGGRRANNVRSPVVLPGLRAHAAAWTSSYPAAKESESESRKSCVACVGGTWTASSRRSRTWRRTVLFLCSFRRRVTGSRSLSATDGHAVGAPGPRKRAEPSAVGRNPDYPSPRWAQGGGALGSYQACVTEGLAQTESIRTGSPGISIGALNAAVIAGQSPAAHREAARVLGVLSEGSRPAARHAALLGAAPADLPDAWRLVVDSAKPHGPCGRKELSLFAPWSACAGGQGLTRVSTTRPAARTLERFVDFDGSTAPARVPRVGGARLLNVRNGN